MNRSTIFSLLATTALLTSLSGCVIVDKNSTPIVGYPGSSDPNAVSKRYPWDQITTMEGSTLYDAHHQVKRYLTLHFPDAKLVSVRANQVGANGKVAKNSSWQFTYQTKVNTPAEPTPAPTASANLQVQSVEIPTQYDVRLLTFTFTGEGQLLAPEADLATTDSGVVIDFDRVLYFNKIIETCLDIGMGMGPAGMQVSLRPTANGGAVYEIDTSVSGREVMARKPGTTYEYYYYYDYDYGYDYDEPYRYDDSYRYSKPQPTPTPTVSPQYYRGKYVINAYTGDIIERPTRL